MRYERLELFHSNKLYDKAFDFVPQFRWCYGYTDSPLCSSWWQCTSDISDDDSVLDVLQDLIDADQLEANAVIVAFDVNVFNRPGGDVLGANVLGYYSQCRDARCVVSVSVGYRHYPASCRTILWCWYLLGRSVGPLRQKASLLTQFPYVSCFFVYTKDYISC